MTNISVTFGAESAGGSITAAKWNQNMSDLINGLSDGTKSINISQITATTAAFTTLSGNPNFSGNPTIAGTLAVTGVSTFTGAATFTNAIIANGNVTFGDALADLTTITGELKGSRLCLTFPLGSGSINQTGGYLNSFNSTVTIGFVAPRAGSIVGGSVSIRCGSFTGAGTFTPNVRKNSVDAFALSAVTINAAGLFASRATQSRGTTTFVAGDVLDIFLPSTAGTYSFYAIGLIEVQFDT